MYARTVGILFALTAFVWPPYALSFEDTWPDLIAPVALLAFFGWLYAGLALAMRRWVIILSACLLWSILVAAVWATTSSNPNYAWNSPSLAFYAFFLGCWLLAYLLGLSVRTLARLLTR